MRALLAGVALLGLLSSAANAGPKEDALAVLEKWTKAFAASDVDGIVKLYATDALFVGTGSKAHEAIVLSDAAVVITGLDTVTGVRDGQPFSANGRVTFVVAKRGSDWQIVHFHRSAMPN
jgi:ketosteroid isomerase-like protein